MIRKIITAGVATLAIALVAAAFVAGIALGLAFILSKTATPANAPTTETQPQTANQPDDLSDVDVWLYTTPTTSPRWSTFGLIHTIKDIPALPPAIAPTLLPPAPEAIAQASSVTLEELVDDLWSTETNETFCAVLPASVQIETPRLLLTPAREHPQPGKVKKPQTPNKFLTNDLTKMSRDALKKRCGELKIPRYSALNKAAMIAAIAAATA